MAADTAEALTPVLQALAGPTRLRVVHLLSSGPRRAGELADAFGVSPPTMNKHLRVQLRAGVVADERPDHDARARVFRMRPESVVALRAWLDQLQELWDEQLRSFKRHVGGSNEGRAHGVVGSRGAGRRRHRVQGVHRGQGPTFPGVRVDLLARVGPTLRRPTVERIESSKHHNMKELRCSKTGALPSLFIFDPLQQASSRANPPSLQSRSAITQSARRPLASSGA